MRITASAELQRCLPHWVPTIMRNSGADLPTKRDRGQRVDRTETGEMIGRWATNLRTCDCFIPPFFLITDRIVILSRRSSTHDDRARTDMLF